MRKFRWLSIFLIAVLIICSPSSVLLANDQVLDEVKYILKHYYVDEVSSEVMGASSIDECLEILGDEHTKYWTEADYRNFLGYVEPQFGGLGIYIEAVDEGIKVVSVIEGTPAKLVGIKAGDIILSVNGISLKGKSAEEAQKFLKGLPGSKANLIIKRANILFRCMVIRAVIDLPTVTGELINNHIGYISINSFGQNTVKEFDNYVRTMDEQADAWIIDLRDNTGGYFDTARFLAGYFIGDKTALLMEERGDISEYKAFKQSYIIEEPVIVLINGNSASSSEILAAALQDHEKALLIGENTYGKGSVQSVFELSNGDFIKVTVARFYSPLNNRINGVGIKPDIEVKEMDAKKVAELLFSSSPKVEVTDNVKSINIQGFEYKVDMSLLDDKDYKDAWGIIMSNTQ
ncbi:MAG: S41 family peptidase [Syntrophomonadaceae bacterium]|nr:S41 family peptidase [Syntrophomonadaceae bacterium]